MRKGQGLTLNTIALAALVLIVIVVLALIFRQFITKSGTQLGNITEETRIQQDVCNNYILGRACQQGSCSPGTHQVYSPTGSWKDCSGVCCEST